MLRAALAAFALLLVRADAHACACCFSSYTKSVIGWSEAGGAVLIESSSFTTCTRHDALQIYPVGSGAPSGCYDLHGDPNKRIACTDIKMPVPEKAVAKTSKISDQFPRPATSLDAKKVRVRTKPPDGDPHEKGVPTFVDVEVNGTWKQVWGQPVWGTSTVTLYPNARNDRALMLLGFHQFNTGNDLVEVHWVELPKPPPPPKSTPPKP